MNKVPITVQGAKKLQDELLQLKSVARPKVIEDIATAREHGDLKENAEYHAAREEMGLLLLTPCVVLLRSDSTIMCRNPMWRVKAQ